MKSFQPRTEILPGRQKACWRHFQSLPREWVLYGGTAIALHLGHRPSVDFDFFSHAILDKDRLRRRLPFLTATTVVQSKPNTWTLKSKGRPAVLFSFFGGLTFGRVDDPQICSDNGLAVASLLDLAAQKVRLVQVRAEAKDYRDIEALIRAGVSLPFALGAAKALYPDFAPMPTLRALSYFKDGDLPALTGSTQKFLAARAAEVDEIPHLLKRADTLVPSSLRVKGPGRD